LILGAYAAWTIALLWIDVWSLLSPKAYGMPGPAISCWFSFSLVAGWIAPWNFETEGDDEKPDPFLDIKMLRLTWRIWSILLLILFVQYLRYGQRILPRTTALGDDFVVIAVASVAIAGISQWTFMVSFRDVHANITWPLLVLLPVSCSYFGMSFTPYKVWTHVPSLPAWLIFAAMLLFFTAILLAGLRSYYPRFKSFSFLYWIFGLTLSLMLVFVVIRTKDEFGAIPTTPARSIERSPSQGS
jgi:hypothetical protein